MVVNHGDKGSASPAARCKSVDEPLPTATGYNTFALADVEVRALSVGEPLKTVTTKNGQGIVEPYLAKYYGTGVCQPVEQPLDTVTTKARFGLVEPTLIPLGNGTGLGIRFRMLQDYELAAAHGFDKSFQFTKKKSVNVKLVGNSWPKETATVLCRQALVNFVDNGLPEFQLPAVHPEMEIRV